MFSRSPDCNRLIMRIARLCICVAWIFTTTARLRADMTAATQPASQPQRVLRVALDPNNLPFSNDKGEGFENKIAQLIADDLHAQLQCVWRAQRRGFYRHTLKEGEADVVLAVPRGFDMALTTRPYYRSTYVLVSKQTGPGSAVQSLDDAELTHLKIGVQLIGDDGSNTPPAHALARRGIVTNLVGFPVYGDYRQANPPARVVEAVAQGEVDVAVVWGPLGGYFAARQNPPLRVLIVAPPAGITQFPFEFDICMGVARTNKILRDELDAVIQRRHNDITQILQQFGVPLVAQPDHQP